MTYRISTDNDRFMAFHIEPKELRARMGDDIMIHMGAEPARYLDRWVRPDAGFYIPDDFPKAIKIPDLTLLSEFLVLNQKAHDALAKQLDGYGEFLPVNCEGNHYYIFNILKMADAMGGVDEKQSIRKEQSGIYLGIEKLVFNEDVVADLLAFRTKLDDYQRVFCSEKFKQLVIDENLLGVKFQDNLEGIA